MLKILIAVFDRDFPKPFDMGRSIGVIEASSTPSPDAGLGLKTALYSGSDVVSDAGSGVGFYAGY